MTARAVCRWWTLLPAVLVGACLSAPASAQASCGDYVVIGGKSAHADHPAAPPRELPCHGPSCRGQAPPAPTPPAPAPSAPAGDEWAGLTVLSDTPEAGPARWLRPADSHPSAPLARSIFHPPRPDFGTSV